MSEQEISSLSSACGSSSRANAEDHGTITKILADQGLSQDQVLAEIAALVYGDLRRIAGRCLAAERRTPTFDSDALVHETFLRLLQQERTRWQNRRHLFAVATRLMRRILVDRARARAAFKRGEDRRPVTLDELESSPPAESFSLLVLDDALQDLARYDASLAQLVELRFFAGLGNGEIAEIQGVTSMTVIRRWRLAKAWLHRYLQAGPAGSEAPTCN